MIIQPIIDELFIQGGGQLAAKSKIIRNLIMRLLGVRESNWSWFCRSCCSWLSSARPSFLFSRCISMKTLGLKVVRNIRDKLYRNLIHQSIDFLSKSKTGDLVSRISNDIEKIKLAVAETLAVYIRETLTLACLLVVIFYQDWDMASISLILIPVAAVPLIYFGRKVKKRGIQSQETIGELANFMSESAMGNKIVKAYNMEEFEINKFRQLNQKHFRINAKIALAYSLAAPIMDIIGGLVAAGLFTIGMHRISQGTLSPGQFTSFLTALFLMYSPIKRLSNAHNDYQQGKAGYERVQADHQHRKPHPGPVVGDGNEEHPRRSRIQECPFRLPARGSGTEKHLFSGPAQRAGGPGRGQRIGQDDHHEHPAALLRTGERRIPHRRPDIRAITLKSLREQIGLVTQDVFLFNDTILNNIAYGRKRYTHGRHPAAPPPSPAPPISSPNCRCSTRPWSASAASSCPTASASASPSPGPC